MNELIKKLLVDNPRLSDFYSVGPVQRASVEDFMQSVIDECINIIQNEVSMKYKDGGETEEFMGGHYAASLLARVKIKYHFGVIGE